MNPLRRNARLKRSYLAMRPFSSRFTPCTFQDLHLPEDNGLLVIAFDPYTYSQGKWLHRNEERQNARKLHFNFEALLEVAMKRSEGAREVVSCEKREDGFNRVFIIEFDNGAKVAAKSQCLMLVPLL